MVGSAPQRLVLTAQSPNLLWLERQACCQTLHILPSAHLVGCLIQDLVMMRHLAIVTNKHMNTANSFTSNSEKRSEYDYLSQFCNLRNSYIQNLFSGACSFRWILAVFHRAGFHTSIVMLWEPKSCWRPLAEGHLEELSRYMIQASYHRLWNDPLLQIKEQLLLKLMLVQE